MVFLTDADYNAIPGSAPFVQPVDPGIFTPVPNPGGIVTRAGAGAILFTPADIATIKATIQ